MLLLAFSHFNPQFNHFLMFEIDFLIHSLASSPLSFGFNLQVAIIIVILLLFIYFIIIQVKFHLPKFLGSLILPKNQTLYYLALIHLNFYFAPLEKSSFDGLVKVTE
jgi:hypothetical protein